jgi:trehalose/maltose transport system permease protein
MAKTPALQIFSVLERVGFWIVVLFFMAYSVFPFYWAINTSLKTDNEISRTPITVTPRNPTVENYRSIAANTEFMTSIVNSALVATGATLLSVIIGGLAAYALGRYRFQGRRMMRYVVLLMSLFPTIAVLPGLLSVVSDMGLTGSILSLIITYPIFTLPTTTWALIVFFQGLPADIEQAAYVDGANTMQLFTRILLPLALPVLLTTGLLTFVGVWSEYLLALAFTAINPEARTVTVAIKFLAGQLSDGELMAAAVFLSVPLILVIYFTQRQFIRNTTEGAVKG